jgi:large subunit ribosomal protein L5
LTEISAQKPLITKAKKSIAGFKIREGMPIGAKVTLRGERMYDFLERLIRVVIPRMRDFRGLPLNAFDQRGNYSIGVNEHTIFPEISAQEVNITHGLQVQLVINSQGAEQSEKLLRSLGFPLERRNNG